MSEKNNNSNCGRRDDHDQYVTERRNELDDDDNAHSEPQQQQEDKFNQSDEISHSVVYDCYIVKGTRIRHIDLPIGCDLLDSAKCEIERIRNRGKQWNKRDAVRATRASTAMQSSPQ